tara:strand:+ start:12548 stop:15238 length:2691 start_codon:yes stop_codon:yes gene_type:complete
VLIARPKTLFRSNLLRLILAAGGFFVLNTPLSSTEIGVDAVIHAHMRYNRHLSHLLDRLDQDGVTWLRERTSWSDNLELSKQPSDARAEWKALKDRGFSIVTYTRGVRGNELKNYPAIDLGIDLEDSYRAAAWMAYTHFDTVDAWELLNEGENVFVDDMPDRATSWEKAVYLGLKAGAHQRIRDDNSSVQTFAQFTPLAYTNDALEAVPVLLGAFAGLPDIHYHAVKAENGFQAYADAWNFHHYGWPSNFSDLIQSHRIFQQSIGVPLDLPLWLTEYGNYRGEIEARLPEAHREQATYFRETTQVAIEEHVAVTMPFIIQWEVMPGFSLFDATFTPYLPWEAYIATLKSKRKKGAPKPLVQPPQRVSPLVLQWVADPATSDANKHNGTYRFQSTSSAGLGWQPIEGTLRLYNFSNQALTGTLNWQTTEGFESVILRDVNEASGARSRLHSGDEVTVPAMGSVAFRLRLFARASSADRYQKGAFSAQFEATTPLRPPETGGPTLRPQKEAQIRDHSHSFAVEAEHSSLITHHSSFKKPSVLYFPVETKPDWNQFTSLPIELSETPQNLRTVTQLALSQRHKVGSAVSADRNRALSASSLSDTPRGPLGTGGPTLPIWIEEDRDPDLIPYEDLAEEGKQRFARETRGAQSAEPAYPSANISEDQRLDQTTTLRPPETGGPTLTTPNLAQIRDHSHSFTTEQTDIRAHPRSSVVEKTVSLAPVSTTSRGLLDWHNRDYPYGYEWTSQSGVWSGMNRLQVTDVGIEANTFAKLRLELDALHPHSQKKPRAVCKVVDGLPADGWIGLIANRTFDASFNVQVFLIDRWGQRWTIDEQLGSNPHLCGIEKLLKLADFDKTYFGNIIPGAVFNPKDVVEIQLHPHGLENLNHPVEIALTVMRPR